MPVTGLDSYAVVNIDEVDLANRLAHVSDKTGGKFQVSFRNSPAGVLYVPAQGENWAAIKVGVMWYLDTRLDSLNDHEWAVANMQSGDVRLKGTRIFLDGAVQNFPLPQDGATTGSTWRWTGTAWAPTAQVLLDDAASKITLQDANLYRSAAGTLKSDSAFFVVGGGAWRLGTTGQISDLGSSTAGLGFSATNDTNLYRVSAGVLKTDGDLRAVGAVDSRTGLAGSIRLSDSVGNGTGNPTIFFGSALDTSLARKNTGNLTTPGGLFVADGTAYAVAIGAQGPGPTAGIAFGSAVDTNLYRAAAGVLKTDGGFANGAYGTTLPASPVDGQQYTLVDSTSAPTYSWLLQWSNTATKWVFQGGAPFYSIVGPNETTSSSTPTDLTTPGPSFTLPRTGTYLARFGAGMVNNTSGAYSSTYLQVNGSTVLTASLGNSGLIESSVAKEYVFTGTAGQVVKLKYAANFGGGTSTFYHRYLSILPVLLS